VVCPTIPVVAAFAEEQSAELKDRVFDEFNTLSVIFRAPAATFLDKDATCKIEDEEDIATVTATSMPEAKVTVDNADTGLLGDLLDESMASQVEDMPAASDGSALPTQGLLDLLDLDAAFSTALPPAQPAIPSFDLQPSPTLEPMAFQEKWSRLPISSQPVEPLPPGAAASSLAGRLPLHMTSHHMPCMAHGGAAPNFKFYFFAKKLSDQVFFLVEANINTDVGTVSMTIKGEDPAMVPLFQERMKAALASAS